jgi:NhaP-type Na+/H+ or K+/H+ antiporter
MDHGVDTTAVAVVAACVVLWGLVSARLERINVTAPIAFVLFGLAVSNEPLALVDIGLHSTAVRHIAEITLALVLFADAARVNLAALRADVGVPARLLGIGLPLTIAAGTAAALLVVHGDLWLAAVIGAAVAPTDAALGASIMHDERVPRRVRRILNVESGLNDGIATPFVAFFIAGAAAAGSVPHGEGAFAAVADIAIGVAAGAAIGVVGGLVLRFAHAHGWSAPAFKPLAVLGLALLAYAATIEAGGNGFVGAFVGGMAFGAVKLDDADRALGFTDDAGELLSLLVWFLFGATMIAAAFEHAEWTDVVFAVLALTVVRMVPVALSLTGSGLDRSTVAFVGWFGPRGLASVVFALIAVDSLDPDDGNRVLTVVTITILISVLAHGLTSAPLAKRYGVYAQRLRQGPEHAPSEPLRVRTMAGNRRLAFSRRGSAEDDATGSG